MTLGVTTDKLTIDSPNNDKSELAKEKDKAHRPGPLQMIRAHDRGANNTQSGRLIGAVDALEAAPHRS